MNKYIVELHDDDLNDVILKAYSLKELVRCKDCKYSQKHYDDIICCTKSDDPFEYHELRFHALNWYCADGERGDT